MRGVDPMEQGELAAARGLAALFRRAEPAQMQIGDAALVQAGRELALRKTRPARGSDRAHVDQELDTGTFQLIQHRLGRRLLIADGEELFRFGHDVVARAYFTRSINSIAPAGARTLPSWMT